MRIWIINLYLNERKILSRFVNFYIYAVVGIKSDVEFLQMYLFGAPPEFKDWVFAMMSFCRVCSNKRDGPSLIQFGT